ncbi:MAG TPA: D-alanyl-D-alanine carboxypeptidase/D-alanyl-D-alanine-endopeptidase [Balneolaceae bacterium]|nr:D-alanyl-D-alanine carboxypeptidase/D-alanyl-D-alanine-endopeptidase [Balneolaceae bacterium]
MKKILQATVFAIFLVSVSMQNARCQQKLLPKIKRLIKFNKANNAFWSLTVRDTTGQIIQSYHSNKLMRPASNLKLLTSATVLHVLGPNFRYRTAMYGVGKKKGQVWQGNIIIRGRGDPSMSGLFYDGDRLHVMQQFFDMLKSRGILKIDGDLIGNDSYFDKKAYPDGWDWDDLTYYYAVPINALSFNNNTVNLTVYANGAVGSTPSIEWFPFDTNYVNFVNEQVIKPRHTYYDEHYHRILGTNTIVLKSSLPKGYVEREALAISNPPRYFMNTFKKYLQQGGIKVTGDCVINDSQHSWKKSVYKKLGVHISPPLRKLVKHLNRKSDNFYAEMLLKTAAAEKYKTQGTTNLGVSLAEKFANSVGIDTTKININDGSGMSSYDLISTNDLCKLLTAVRHRKIFKYFRNSLPIAGEDGTLKDRFRRQPLKGNIFAKTGYVSGVRAISGYLKTKNNKTLIFSLDTNDYNTKTRYIDSIEKSILRVLYNHY